MILTRRPAPTLLRYTKQRRSVILEFPKTSPIHPSPRINMLGDCDSCKILLDHKADVESKYRKEFSPLYIACQRGHFKVVELLIQYGAEIDVVCSITPIFKFSAHLQAALDRLHSILRVKKGTTRSSNSWHRMEQIERFAFEVDSLLSTLYACPIHFFLHVIVTFSSPYSFKRQRETVTVKW